MTGNDTKSFHSYRLGNMFNVHLQDGICPELQEKIEHCRADAEPAHLTIAKGDSRPNMFHYPQQKLHFVDDDFFPVVVAWPPVADELLVSDGRYEVVWQDGVYEISPSKVIISGGVVDSFLEHQVLRPLINSALVPQGALLVHGGAVRIDGKVILILGESGKTSIILGLMAQGADYLGDEHVFLDTKGVCTTYTPYLDMDDRHFVLFPELLDTCYPDRHERSKVERRLSFFRMGGNLRGGNFLSRQLRELLTTRSYFKGLTCRFDRPFPQVKMCEPAPITHVFHLEASQKKENVFPTTAMDIARVETASTWIHQGYNYQMARLAGMPHLELPMMEQVFAEALSHAECNRLRVRLRQQRTKEDVDRRIDEIIRTIG